MNSKPIVDELQAQFKDRVQVTRVDLLTPAGRELAARYQFTFTPFFVGLDSNGNVIWRQPGLTPSAASIESLLAR
jgi:thioredoxin-related protein